MTVKDFLKVFRNPQVVVDIVDMGDESIAKVNANGKDILKDEISGREIYDIKVVNAQNVKVIVTEVDDSTNDTPNTDPTEPTTNTDPVDPTTNTDPTGNP